VHNGFIEIVGVVVSTKSNRDVILNNIRAGLKPKALMTICLSVAAVALMACADVGYFWQSASGHVRILNAASPVDELLSDQQMTPRLRQQLEAAKDIRAFAISALALPDNRSYRQYADLKRQFVVWNVFATPPLSLKLHTWCFPVVGCLSYKGYFAEGDAQRLGDQMRSEGFDVSVAGIPAYSTLGWTPDPLLNTFIYYPKGELARMVFHELAHQVVYINDDTAFNESFATAVEELGVELWLTHFANESATKDYRLFDERRRVFKSLLLTTRDDLKALYKSDMPDEQKLAQKKIIFDALLSRYQTFRDTEWKGWKGYDKFFESELNNAKLAGVGLYSKYVPAFKVLFAQSGNDFSRFYKAVDELGRLPRKERDVRLDELDAQYQQAAPSINTLKSPGE
jgi:predicted aminopeptidase